VTIAVISPSLGFKEDDGAVALEADKLVAGWVFFAVKSGAELGGDYVEEAGHTMAKS
jgi:hypothetical protein